MRLGNQIVLVHFQASAAESPAMRNRLMGGRLVGDLEPAAILEIGGDAGRTEGMTADLSLDPGLESSSANHSDGHRVRAVDCRSVPPSGRVVRKSGALAQRSR